MSSMTDDKLTSMSMCEDVYSRLAHTQNKNKNNYYNLGCARFATL